MRDRTLALRCQGFGAATIYFLFWCLLAPAPVRATTVSPVDEYRNLITAGQSIQPLGTHPFGESINLYNGSLSFEVTDISIPGTGPVLQLSRSFDTATSGLHFNLNRERPFGDWGLDIPHIETYSAYQANVTGWFIASYGIPGHLDRCTRFNPPPPVNSQQGAPPWSSDQWWYGYHLVIPGEGSQDLLRSAAILEPTMNGASFPIATKQGWRVTCGVKASDGGEGFLAIAPDGTRYTFAHLIYRPLAGLHKPLAEGPDAISADSVQPMVAPFDIISRRDALMYVTRIEDRFGNTLTYHWSTSDPNDVVDNHLTSIVASDGREIDLTYYPGTPLVHAVTVRAAGGASARTWTYAYSSTSSIEPSLTRVRLPDGSAWSYQMGSLQTAPLEIDHISCPNDTPFFLSGAPATGSMTTPSGLTATFTMTPKLHGRSHVPEHCKWIGNDPRSKYPAIPNVYAQFSLTKEVLTGPGIPTETWTYSYSQPNQSWTRDHCGNSCPSTIYTDVTNPLGQDLRYTYSNRFDASEGKLLRTDAYSGAVGSTDLRSVVNAYANPTGGPWPTSYGRELQPYDNHAQIQEKSPLQTHTISQGGATFTTHVNTYDSLARAINTTESSSLGYRRTITTTYADDTNHWVLGLVTQLTTNGIVDSQTRFDSLDQPTSEYAFGRLISVKAWNVDGTLASLADADHHTTVFSNWYRGLPGKVTFADGTGEAATVNGNGWITALTDENGFTTHYAYDPMGRLTEIAYPTGDNVAWNPTYLSFAQVAGAEFGIAGGHWKQVVHTGNGYVVTYFDAFWRPLVTEHYDAGNEAGTLNEVVQRYDTAGRKVFASYPTKSTTSYTQSMPGIHMSYDALDRVTEIDQDSELGTLPTITQYLSGFRTQVTDPNGHSTITGYRAYGTPTMQWPVSIAAPDGEFTRIKRDAFGKPLAITRTGTAGSPSLTRSFAYNTYQQLCGRTEPETGTTAFGYDPTGNLIWSASGLSAVTGSCYNESQASGSKRMVTRAYDARNRVVTIDYPDGFSNARYGYAPDGVLLSASVANGGFPVTTTYTRDKRRLLTSESQNLPNAAPSTLQYSYDANGHLAATVYPDGRMVGYLPNALGQPTRAGAYATNVRYYPNGAIAAFTYGDGAVHTMTEDERGLVGRSRDALNGTAGMDFAYDYDGDGNVAAITDYLPGNLGNVDMVYDALDRLVEADSPMFGGDGKALYSYDGLNNLRSARVGSRSSFDYVYNANDQLAELTDPSSGMALANYTYDAQGNLARKNAQAYQFDVADRLVSVPGAAVYRYDAAGRRVQKVEITQGKVLGSDYNKAGTLMYQFNPANLDSTDYIYLGSTLVARVVGNHSEVIGSIDGVTSDATPLLTGWACSTGISTPISVEVFVGGPSGGDGTRISTVTADQASGPAVASACHTNGTTYRFSVPLDTATRAQYGGQPIYMYGDSPVGNGNNELQGSGMYDMPPNPGVPQPPAQIVVPSTSSTGAITVSWSASDTATSYVLQQQFNGGSWTQVYSGAATSTALSGLGNGKYVYRVQACNANGCSAFTGPATLTVALVPASPASINVPANSYTPSFTVSWSASANATNYVLEESVDGGGWGEVYSGAATNTTVTVDASGSYRFQVAACSIGGCSGFTTSTYVAVTLPPPVPTLTGPSSSTTGTFTLTWNAVSGATGYRLNQSLNGTVSRVYSGSGTFWSSTNLGNGAYDYQVFACNVAGCMGSNGHSVTVLHTPVAPAYVTAPQRVPYPGTGWTITWAPSDGASSYKVQRTDTTTGVATFLYSATGTSSGDYTVPGVYLYAVQACNASGCSGWTNAGNTTTVFCAETSTTALQPAAIKPQIMQCGGTP